MVRPDFHQSGARVANRESLEFLCKTASVVTPKPANGGQGKTGQREKAGDRCKLCFGIWHLNVPNVAWETRKNG